MKKAPNRSTIFCLFIKICYIFKRYFTSLLFSRSFPTPHREAARILLHSWERWSIVQLAEGTKTRCRESGVNYRGVVPRSRDMLCSQLADSIWYSDAVVTAGGRVTKERLCGKSPLRHGCRYTRGSCPPPSAAGTGVLPPGRLRLLSLLPSPAALPDPLLPVL